MKIDEEIEKNERGEKVLIGSPIKKDKDNNYATNPKEIDFNLNNMMSNDSSEKLNLNENNKKNPLIHSMKNNKNYDFINFSIEHINKSKY